MHTPPSAKYQSTPKPADQRTEKDSLKPSPASQPLHQSNSTSYLTPLPPPSQRILIIDHKRTRPPFLYPRKQCAVVNNRRTSRVKSPNGITFGFEFRETITWDSQWNLIGEDILPHRLRPENQHPSTRIRALINQSQQEPGVIDKRGGEVVHACIDKSPPV